MISAFTAFLPFSIESVPKVTLLYLPSWIETAMDCSTEANRRGSEWMQSAGLRPTRQRVTLAALLVGDGKDRHVTAEDLYAAVCRSGGKVSLATVYNALKAFCDAGLMREITVDGSRSYFDTNTSNHPHYFWEDSGAVTDAPAGQMEISRLPEAPEGTEIVNVGVVIRLRRKPAITRDSVT